MSGLPEQAGLVHDDHQGKERMETDKTHAGKSKHACRIAGRSWVGAAMVG